MSKTTLKSNCKHVPTDGVVRAQNKCEIRKCPTYWGGHRQKFNGHRKTFQKYLKQRVATPTFYVTKWIWQAYSTRDYFLVVSKRHLDCILAEPEEGCQGR